MDEIFQTLIRSRECHVPGAPAYLALRDRARTRIAEIFSSDQPVEQPFWEFGPISFPYHRMGAISSLDLFGLDELIIFAFYHANRSRYSKVADIGANIGLHSVMLGRCGYSVSSYEPDPEHFVWLRANLERNAVSNAQPIQAAISTTVGKMRFVRVLGNTTGSHLAGVKDSYGDKDEFEVAVEDISAIYAESDLIKMDAEGHEAALLSKLSQEEACAVDVIAEIGSQPNASAIYNDLMGKGINMLSQKTGWGRVRNVADMPTSHREGSLFITMKDSVPW